MQRTLSEKVADIKTTQAQFAEVLTAPAMREMMDRMTNSEAQQAVAASGDVNAVVALVRASIDLQRLISANDRAALIAATMVAGAGGTRLYPLEDGD